MLQVARDLRIASRLLVKRGLPVNLIFFVTSKCNLLCKHCFYWEELNRPKRELSLDEIEVIAKSLPNLLSLSLTGGEPYLRPDLPRIAAAFEKYSRVQNIQIPSNGLLVDKTIERAAALLKRVRKARVCTGVSLDGPKEIHDDIRQNGRSFEQAILCLQEFKKLKSQHPNLSVGVALTVTSANQYVLDEFYRYVEEDLEPDAITITLTRGDPIDSSLKNVDLMKYQVFAERVIRYRKAHRMSDGWKDRLIIAKEEETYRLIGQAASATSRIAPCYGGELVGVLSETGEVYVCETLEKSMGNVRDFDCDFGALWGAQQARKARSYQKELGCQCTYECAMSVNTLFNPRKAARIFWNAL